jgi:hypothetical protein
MNMIFKLLMALICSVGAMAQTTLYVRTGGNDVSDGLSEASAKRTIVGAGIAAQAGDIIDVGPGAFAGGKLAKGVVIQGANANFDIARWDASTIITSTIDLGNVGANAVITLVGLEFGAITPLAGKAANANITIYNCKFLGSKPIVLTGLGWGEMFFTASVLDGQPEPAKVESTKVPAAKLPAMAASALQGGDVGLLIFRENRVRNYAKSAIDVSGSSQILRLSYNEFTNCNASGDSMHAAVRIDVSDIAQEVTVENSLFTGCATAVATTGVVGDKPVVVRRNNFRQTPEKSPVLRTAPSTVIGAPCNAFHVPYKDGDTPLGADVIEKAIMKLVRGPVSVSTPNLAGNDADGDAIGFEPEKSAGCPSEVSE